MVSPPIFTLAAVGLGVAALACLVRVSALQLSSAYPALTCFFLFQVSSTLATCLFGQETAEYEWVYLGLLLLEWFVYGFMLREIYNGIFSDFLGIAFLGRWSIYLALFATGLIALFSILAARQLPKDSQEVLVDVEMAAHCLTFGFAFLLLTILVAISRYPLRLHKNVLVNTMLFGAVLIGEAAGLIAERLTSRQYTNALNLAVTFDGVFCLALWPLLLTREGGTETVIVRRAINLGEENRLLAQLGSINSILIRSARR